MQAFIRVTKRVRRRRLRPKISPNPARTLRRGRAGRPPDLRLLDPPLDPEREEGRDDADEEDPSPAPDGQDERGHGRRRGIADGPRALDDAQGLAAVLGRPGLGDERGPAGPLPAHAEAEEDAEDGQHDDARGEAAGRREDGIDEDAGHQGLAAAEAVGEDAEDEAADGRGDEGQRAEKPRRRLGHAQVGHQRRQDHGVEHDVEGVEHPAERGGDERPPGVGRSLLPPGEARHQRISMPLRRR